jgi:hypothetical protein
MPDALFYALILAAVLVCPVHMWWANRRGHRPACCPPKREQPAQDLDALLERRRNIEARLAELHTAPAGVDSTSSTDRITTASVKAVG